MPPSHLDRINGFLQTRLPRPVRGAARYLTYLPLDLYEGLAGRREGLLPPRRLRWVGAGDFHSVGQFFLDVLGERCGLASGSSVLDVGCGVGRLAIPLTTALEREGRYRGFDVWRPAVRWCSKNISPRFPNFVFHHVDVFNGEYNPKGREDPADFEFPFPDNCFDVVLAISVYTHLLTDTAQRYAAETARVLKHGGYSLQTFFLLNPETRELRKQGFGCYAFDHAVGSAMVDDPLNPESAVAYQEHDVHSALAGFGLEVLHPVVYGSWCGRGESLSFQDIVIARKANRRLAVET